MGYSGKCIVRGVEKEMQEWERERPGALLARRTRGPGRPSFDARSRGQPWPPPPILGRKSGGWERKRVGLAIPCARATRGRGLPSLDARTMRNRQAAAPRKVEGEKGVGRYAQSRTVG